MRAQANPSAVRPLPCPPEWEVELIPGTDACADCSDRLRQIGWDWREELEYVPGGFIVNRIVRARLTWKYPTRHETLGQ
jgi:transposase